MMNISGGKMYKIIKLSVLIILIISFSSVCIYSQNGLNPYDLNEESAGRPRSADDPAKPPAGVPKGVYKQNQNDYYMPYYTAHPGKKALAYFAHLIKKDEKNPEYWGRFSLASVQMGKYDEAKSSGLFALKLKENNQWALYSLALTARLTAEYEEAVKYYEQLMTTDFKDFKDFYVSKNYLMAELGDLYYKLNKLEQAESWFRKSLDMEKNDYLAMKMMERFYCRTNQYEKAIRLYADVLKVDSVNLNALMNLGILYTYFGKYDQSIKNLEKAIEIDNSIMKLHYFLHRAYLMSGNMVKAKELIEKCREFSFEKQVEIDRVANIISPYPCAEVIFQQVYMALGDFDRLKKSVKEDILDEDMTHGSIREDMANDYEGYPEFRQEDSLFYLMKSDVKKNLNSRWFDRFREKTIPQNGKNRKLTAEISNLIKEEKYLEANAKCKTGLNSEPDNLLLLAQAGITAGAIKDYKQVMELFEKSLKIPVLDKRDNYRKIYVNIFNDNSGTTELLEKDETEFMARCFTILAITDHLIIRSKRDSEGKIHYERTDITSFLTDEQLNKLGNTLSKIRENMKSIRKRSDSITALSMADLLKSDVSITLSLEERAGHEFKDYLENDGKYKIILNLYNDYGKYFGY